MEITNSENPPLVSVIVPNYNHARYLDLRLMSILQQEFTDFEVIFLDDASSDDSLEILQKYLGDKRIRLVVNEKNSGSTFKQWNKGAGLAKGKYLWFAESDDFAEPDFLLKTVNLLEQDSKLGLVYSQSVMVDQEGKILGLTYQMIWRSDPKRWLADYKNNGEDEILNYLGYECTIPNASAVVIRKFVFDAVGKAKEIYKLHGDYVLWFDMLRKSDVAYLAAPLNHFRFSHASVRNRLQGNGFDAEERYLVVQYMFDQVDFPTGVKERICFYLVCLWLHPDRIKTPITRHVRIAKLASKIDRHLLRHVAARLIFGPFRIFYMKSIGYKKRKKVLDNLLDPSGIRNT